MFNIKPKEDTFFNIFISTGKITYKASTQLRSFMDDLTNAEENLKNIKETEHEGDRNQHLMRQELNKTFLTPFDREDIYLMANGMDDIIDLIESSSSRFVMLNVKSITEEAKQLADMIVKCCSELSIIMNELSNIKKYTDMEKHIIEINRLEEEGDKISRSAIKELFRSGEEVLEVIKWREIYQYLENTLDSCEHVANIIEGVIMKNA
ncbi:DUF47 family protein [Clostridium sp. JN-9]|uniref:DUF47 domain-containing protein n=1 Tax=Clostridium sp. JN-9 TaxID=2507159 RepID=UPI000FFDF8C2|nr:DUF47 family protein [Clostridium sp. JN-9]QAT40128.1 DUF47 domain-containing protein [Clostridium sp. JN-9]